jgi:hypothetical protein
VKAIDAASKGHTHYRKLVESLCIAQWDLVREDGKFLRPTVVIESVEQYVPPVRRKKRMPDGSYRDELLNKLLISFVGKRKKWIAGPVSQKAIAGIYGPHVEGWIGKKITLYVDESVMMGPRKVGGIRVVNTAPTESPTDDPLDEPVDAERSAMLAETFGGDEEAPPMRQPGED